MKISYFKWVFVSVFIILDACSKQNPELIIQTESGEITVELYVDKAPVTALNFLSYIDRGIYKNASFYRTVTLNNQPVNPVKIEVIQGGLFENDSLNIPIFHETTARTGILHKDGVISMARLEPGTASTDFFICIGDQPELDFGGLRNPDGQGFAAFGQVVKGMDIVREIHNNPAQNQYFTPTIQIFNIIHNKD